ncbi:MAG: sugar-binding protein [Armatimonadota bacterium]
MRTGLLGAAFTAVMLLLLGYACPSQAQAGAPVECRQQKVANRYFADQRTVKVDGELSEWNFMEGAVSINADTGLLNPAPVRSKADSSALVKFAWDAKYLYLAAQVKDQSLKPLVTAKDMPWSCDSLILVVTPFGATKGSDRYQTIKTVATSPEPFFGFSYYTEKTGPRMWTEHSRYLVKVTKDGYNLEVAMSLADIGFDPRAGDRVKMAFILADLDADGKFSQITAGFPSRFVSNSTNFWYDLRFRGAASWAGELVTSQVKFTDAKDIRFTGDIDSTAARVQLKGVALKDRTGRTVALLPVESTMKPGMTTMINGKFSQPNLTPGIYQVAALVEEAGKPVTVAAQTMFEVVASDEPVQGTVGKLPNRYIVPDPYRYAFPSNSWGYKQQTITKEDYIKMVKRVYDFEYASIYSKGENANAGIHGFGYCMPPYALYKHTGDVQYLKTSLALVRNAAEATKKDGPTPWWITQYKLVNMFLDDPNVGETDKKWLREYYPMMVNKVWETSRPQEWGAFNRALLWGGMLEIAAKTMPDNPNAKAWKDYADLEWSSWWPYRDHDENSSDYNGSSMMDYLDWAEFRDPALLKDPGFAKWAERYVYQVTPPGGMPGYGDASPWNASWAFWVPLFERMATITRDGRYKWAAHRLLEYANRQMDDLFSYHQVYDSAAAGCAWAYLFADDTVQETAPELKSRLLTRAKITQVDDAFKKEMFDKHGITGLYYRLNEGTQPDKLILRSGGDPFAPCGMIELCSNAGHHMSTVPNFNNFMDKRAVLLTDLGYYEKGPEYHNVVYIEDMTGIAPEVPDEVVSVPVFAAGSRNTYASIVVENYKSWPVTNDRRVLFTDLGLVVVKDLLDFKQPFVCRLRQQWQAKEVSPKSGENWVNTNISHVLMSGLGLGRGVQRWNNPNWDLLIYFTPQAGRDYEVFDRSLENEWQAVPLRISQRYRGLPEAGKPVHFTTLLWPHKPMLQVEEYANRIGVMADTPQLTVFKVNYDDTRTVYLGINDTGEAVQVGDITTDARVFVLEGNPTGGAFKPTSLFAQGVTQFTMGGKALHQSTEKVNVDKRL